MTSLHSRLRACTGPHRVCVSLLASVLSLYAPLSPTQAAVSAAAPAGISSPLDPEVAKLLQSADDAAKRGNANLALIELKNAVRLAPKNGEVRTRLGVMLLSFGQTVAAERELRQARNDGAPEEIALPPLLQAMLIRKELKELLAEFSDPPQGTQDKAAPDILKARAVAFQVLGQTKDANAAIDRALGLRRDLQMLVIRATLAREQNDLALALRLADEVSLLAPASQEAAVLKISLFHQ